MSTIQTLDCRGQQCPAPILATARAVKNLGTKGGTLEILADDDAFPMDLQSWARSSGAAVLELAGTDDGHRAIIRVASARPTVDAPLQLDCRGMECPQPILEIARAARSNPKATLEVVADDDAFQMDVESWCRSAGAQLASFENEAGVYRAVITLGAPRAASEARRETPRERVPARSPAPAPFQPSVPEFELDCLGMECPQPILEVARKARAHPGALFTVVADDDAFVMDIQSWCRTTNATLVSMERDGSTHKATVQLPSVRSVSRAEPEPEPSPPREEHPAPGDVRIELTADGVGHWEQQLDHAAATPHASRLVVSAAGKSATPRLMQWCQRSGHQLVTLNGTEPVVAVFDIVTGGVGHSLALSSASDLSVGKRRKATILVLHNDKEALLAALLVANGAASQGMDVMLYFTFWGLNLLRGDLPNPAHKPEKVSWSQRLFKWLMPKGPKRQGLGKLNFGGMGGGMMKSLMKKKNIMDLPELLDAAQEQEVRFVACTMSMNVMGVTKRDLHPYPTLEYGGVAAFVESAGSSEISLVF